MAQVEGALVPHVERKEGKEVSLSWLLFQLEVADYLRWLAGAGGRGLVRALQGGAGGCMVGAHHQPVPAAATASLGLSEQAAARRG